MGLEALKRKKVEYRHSTIPLFLELRKIKAEKIDRQLLETKIAQQFDHCGLPESAECTAKFLEQGRLLILLDGLDEVPTELKPWFVNGLSPTLSQHGDNSAGKIEKRGQCCRQGVSQNPFAPHFNLYLVSATRGIS